MIQVSYEEKGIVRRKCYWMNNELLNYVCHQKAWATDKKTDLTELRAANMLKSIKEDDAL